MAAYAFNRIYLSCDRSPVVDIIVAGSHLLALHDATFISAGNAASRNVVQVWDPTAQVRSGST